MNSSHPNLRLWCMLAAIPVIIVIAVYTFFALK